MLDKADTHGTRLAGDATVSVNERPTNETSWLLDHQFRPVPTGYIALVRREQGVGQSDLFENA